MLRLAAADYELAIEPARGGSIAGFRWRGQPLLRGTCGPSILDTGCFPLVPFSNRIAHGRFRYDGRDVTLSPNFPGPDHPHPLHGFGWLAEWAVVSATGTAATIAHVHAPRGWPWAYRAEQRFALGPEGLAVTLSVTNDDAGPMPAGLGFHPYFPRDDDTVYRGLHHVEWTTADDGLPLGRERRDDAVDWWAGAPVGSRTVDTVYAGREGPLTIRWPRRGLALSIEPSDLLDHSVVYTPAGRDFFCVEPVSHPTDAINRDTARMARLMPGQSLSASIRLTAQSANGSCQSDRRERRDDDA